MRPELKRSRVVLYDPNSLNPYGLEVAALLAGFVPQVDYWGVESRLYPPSQGFVLHPVLGGPRGNGQIQTLMRRLFGPLAVIRSAGLKDPLVLVWVRDSWDSIVFLCRALLGGNTLFVHHNPAQIRPRGGLRGRLERALLRHARVCVHAEWMADLVDSASREVVVTPHPPYALSVEGPQERVLGDVPRVALVGALRPDKGSLDLPAIAVASGGGWVLRVVGPSVLDEGTARGLTAAQVCHEYAAGSKPPSDADVCAALAGCAVMIAPYRLVTESGSVLLALSLGVPVIGYISPALERLVTGESLVADADGLGLLLKEYLEEPWETFRLTPGQLAEQSSRGWRRALA